MLQSGTRIGVKVQENLQARLGSQPSQGEIDIRNAHEGESKCTHVLMCKYVDTRVHHVYTCTCVRVNSVHMCACGYMLVSQCPSV